MSDTKEKMLFSKANYIMIIAGVSTIFLGFILMIGGKMTDPNVFDPEVFNFRRITLAPIVIITGLGIVMYGIMKKNPEHTTAKSE